MTSHPKVTEGFAWPPEILLKLKTIAVRMKPCDNAARIGSAGVSKKKEAFAVMFEPTSVQR